MCVPAHDQRDFEFANKYDLPIKVVIQPENSKLDATTMTAAFVDDGILTDSGEFTGMNSRKAISAISDHLATIGAEEVHHISPQGLVPPDSAIGVHRFRSSIVTNAA